jgi:predicted dinucleotide-binding enzyme
MRIGIIGAGNIGGTLTRLWTKLGHQVEVANSRGPDTLTALAEETGARPVTVAEAPKGKDVVVVTIPLKNVPMLKGVLTSAPADAAIIDTCNYYPKQRDGRIAEIEAGMVESRWVASQLGRPVVKAFNNIFAGTLFTGGLPKGDPDRIALPVAGDDPAQKARVMELVDQVGFDPVDAGGIDESWRQQPGTPCYTADLGRDALKAALARASRERPAAFRA